MLGAAIVISGTNHASAQSVGFNFTTNGNWSGLNDNAGGVSLAPAEVAGVYPQSHWNNLGRSGSVNPGVVTNSAGNPVSLSINWDAPATASTGAATNLNTPNGKLMDGFTFSWGPGPATALANSVYDSANNNKPLIYLSGLTAWLNSVGAAGYNIVVYATGYSYWETGEYLGSIRHRQSVQQHDGRRGGFDPALFCRGQRPIHGKLYQSDRHQHERRHYRRELCRIHGPDQ